MLKFLGFMWNPLSWVMEAAAIMAIALANGGVSAESFSFFVCLVAEKQIRKGKKIYSSPLFSFSGKITKQNK